MLGQAKASELFYTAKRMNAQRHWLWGLVNKVVAADELEQTVDELVATITANAPMTLGAFKACANQWKLQDSQAVVQRSMRWSNPVMCRKDFAEGRLAFSEKRVPVFKGK